MNPSKLFTALVLSALAFSGCDKGSVTDCNTVNVPYTINKKLMDLAGQPFTVPAQYAFTDDFGTSLELAISETGHLTSYCSNETTRGEKYTVVYTPRQNTYLNNFKITQTFEALSETENLINLKFFYTTFDTIGRVDSITTLFYIDPLLTDTLDSLFIDDKFYKFRYYKTLVLNDILYNQVYRLTNTEDPIRKKVPVCYYSNQTGIIAFEGYDETNWLRR
ncbi:MAG: hypothetical protein V4616_12415 [Bacteroidota bacterium]